VEECGSVNRVPNVPIWTIRCPRMLSAISSARWVPSAVAS
jgi:hypothetical protein